MPLQDLGTITTLQKMVGVKLVAKDANETQVVSFNGLDLSVVPANFVQISNIQILSDLPAGSAFTFDVAALGPLGQVTITATGRQVNLQPTFSTSYTLEVITDPSTPGPPTHWVATPGTIVPQ